MSHVGILLAAGNSQRFGADKLMEKLGNGERVGIASGQKLISALPRSIAVVRSDDSALASMLRLLGFEIIQPPTGNPGMGDSLAAAVRSSTGADGWLVCLADMPWIQFQTLCSVINGLAEGADICAPRFDNKRGHPVGFNACFGDRLASLSGDVGAKGIIDDHPEQLREIDVNDAGIIRDIDTPQDLH
ncbi:MAG: nucleotidyltransferase family protein [Gammaproteobacteria bacterium]